MNLRRLLKKINDAVRPMHLEGEGGGLLDAKVGARLPGGPIGTSPSASAPSWVKEDEESE